MLTDEQIKELTRPMTDKEMEKFVGAMLFDISQMDENMSYIDYIGKDAMYDLCSSWLAKVDEINRLRSTLKELDDALKAIRSYGDDPYGIARKALEASLSPLPHNQELSGMAHKPSLSPQDKPA